jgi:tetratricopeptide (TPR) repeat protein
MMKRILIVTCLFWAAAGSASLPQTPAERRLSISVLTFEFDTLTDPPLKWVRSGVPDYLQSILSRKSGLRLVERARIQSILDEMKLGMTGNMDKADASQASQLVGAQCHLIGTVSKTGPSKVLIVAKAVDTKTSELIATEMVRGDKEQIIPQMCDSLAAKLITQILLWKPQPPSAVSPDRAEEKPTAPDEASGAGMYFTARSLSSTSHFYRAQALEDQGDWRKSIEEYKKAIELDPDFARAYVNLGAVLLLHDRIREAESMLTRAVEIAPGLALGYLNLGMCRGTSGDLDGAVKNFERALSLDPANSEISIELGKAYYLQGRYPTALRTFNDILRNDSLYAAARYYRGILYKRINKTDSALADWRMVIVNEEPFFRDIKQQAYKQLGDYSLSLRRHDEAVDYFQHALSMNVRRQDPQVLGKIELGLGKAFLQTNQPSEAAECFEKALNLIPNEAELHLYYGLTLTAQSKVDRAIAAFETAADLDTVGTIGAKALELRKKLEAR